MLHPLSITSIHNNASQQQHTVHHHDHHWTTLYTLEPILKPLMIMPSNIAIRFTGSGLEMLQASKPQLNKLLLTFQPLRFPRYPEKGVEKDTIRGCSAQSIKEWWRGTLGKALHCLHHYHCESISRWCIGSKRNGHTLWSQQVLCNHYCCYPPWYCLELWSIVACILDTWHHRLFWLR